MMTKEELKKLKTATKKLTKWESSGKAFGHYKVIEAKATDTNLANEKGADKIYEFYCLMKILEDLSNNYTILLVPGSKIFPEATAPKKGWAYFIIENKTNATNKFQVCYGTKIKLSWAKKPTFAPDISIQKHDSTDDPNESMVELIMDAKFKYTNTSPLLVEQIHAFIQRVNALETKEAALISLDFTSTFSNIKGNCLLTNGKALPDQKDYCNKYKILQVQQFDIGKTHNVVG